MSARVESLKAHMVVPDENGCWVWFGYTDRQGYGKVAGSYGTTLAHRLFYTDLVGPIPAGLALDHLCRNKSCVNPAHLVPVTTAENNRRNPTQGVALARYHGSRTHCDNGHEFTPENTGMRRDGHGRRCRTCDRERKSELALRKREAALDALRTDGDDWAERFDIAERALLAQWRRDRDYPREPTNEGEAP